MNLGGGDKVGGLSLVEPKLLKAVEEVAAVTGKCSPIDVEAVLIWGDSGAGAVVGWGDGLSGRGGNGCEYCYYHRPQQR